ncbi:MAG: DinB family protein [Candidatus Heimdallarchaeaceae archaeon]
MSEKELKTYIKIIEKSYSSFREHVENFPEEALDWKINNFSGSPRWIISHVIKDQYPFTDFIVKGKTSSSQLKIEEIKGDISNILKKYDKMVKDTVESMQSLKEEDLTLIREMKNYKLSVEELLFEFIYHINHHCGQLAMILGTWKRSKKAENSKKN